MPGGVRGVYRRRRCSCCLCWAGSIGALLGMRVFRHKTKHWYFVWGVPAILLAQLALAVWLLCR